MNEKDRFAQRSRGCACCACARRRTRIRAADHGQHHRAHPRRPGRGGARASPSRRKNAATGFIRTDVSDGEGIYRLTALPVGTYDITAELQGFSKVENKGIVVNVGQTLDLNMTLKLATRVRRSSRSRRRRR